MARTDAAAAEGLDAAIDRACTYREAAADTIFPEAMRALEDYAQVRRAVNAPILVNLTEFGSTPLFTLEALKSASVDMALYCCGAYRVMNATPLRFYRTLRQNGTHKSVFAETQTRDELYRFLDHRRYENKLDELLAIRFVPPTAE